jgi:hypothetical protein
MTQPVTLEFRGLTHETTIDIERSPYLPVSGQYAGVAPLPDFYDVETSGGDFSAARVCLPFNYIDALGLVGPRASHLRPYANAGGGWTDITTDIDVANGIVCGDTDHVGDPMYFMMGVPDVIYAPETYKNPQP